MGILVFTSPNSFGVSLSASEKIRNGCMYLLCCLYNFWARFQRVCPFIP